MQESYKIIYKNDYDPNYIWLDEEIAVNKNEYDAWQEITAFKHAMD